MNELKAIINQARERFTDPEVSEPPELRELAAEYDIDLKLLKTVAFKENWDAIRNRKLRAYERELVRQEYEGIEKATGDIAAARTKMFNDTFQILQKHLNPVMESIADRLPEMKDSDVIAHARTLLQLSVNLQKMLDQLQKDAIDETNNERKDAQSFIHDALKGKVITAITNGTEIGTFEELEHDITEQDKIFAELDEK
jgi:hypothetical protein